MKPFIIALLSGLFVLLINVEVKCELRTFHTMKCWSNNLHIKRFQVKFYFSSRKGDPQIITNEAPFRADLLNFDPRRRTTVIIHGFLGKGQGKYMRRLKEKLLLWV